MLDSAPLRTVGLVEAAGLVRLHKNTLQERVKAGLIPGAKIGRSWVFLESDLIAYIRSQYPTEKTSCLSTNKRAAPSGGPASPSRVAPGYVGQLEKLIAKRRKSATTSSK